MNDRFLRFAAQASLCLSIVSVGSAQIPTSAPASAPAAVPARQAVFDLREEITVRLPEGAKTVNFWIAVPQEDADQDIAQLKVVAPFATRSVKDSRGNRQLFGSIENPTDRSVTLTETFTLTRREIHCETDPKHARPLTPDELKAEQTWIDTSTYVEISNEVRKIAEEQAGDIENPLLAAQRLYEWVLGNVESWRKNPKLSKPSLVGSSQYALTTHTGSAVDMQALWSALARARGIPSRTVFGSVFKSALEGKPEDIGVHAWGEFFVGGIGWMSQDVGMADLYAPGPKLTPEARALIAKSTPEVYHGPSKSRADWYFGNLGDRRVTFSRGRDLILDPPAKAGKVNYLAAIYVEVDGKPLVETADWTRVLTYTAHK